MLGLEFGFRFRLGFRLGFVLGYCHLPHTLILGFISVQETRDLLRLQ